jgi:hypothetical protein
MIASTALQDAIALVTVAMNASADDELRVLVDEFQNKDNIDELLLAVVSLCRSLCIATSTLVHVLDDHLTDDQAAQLSDDELVPVAMSIIRGYANTAAQASEHELNNDAAT